MKSSLNLPISLSKSILITEERQRAEGRGQKEENINFALCLHGLEQVNLFMGFAFCLLNLLVLSPIQVLAGSGAIVVYQREA
ncbi:MAG: hypothetical protein ACYTXE_45535, partial [Nostoc sp.]